MVGKRLRTAPRAAQGSKGEVRTVPVRERRRSASNKGVRARTAIPAPAEPVEGVLFDLGDTLLDEGKGWFADDPLLPGVRRTLGELDPQYRLAILSNTRNATRQDLALELARLGIARHFRAILTSSDIGWRKPHPLAFEAALAAMGVPAPRAVMVGNELDADVAGAKAMGMRTVHIRWSPRYRGDPTGEAEMATVTIEDFNDLPVALERARGRLAPPRTATIREDSLFQEGLVEQEEEHHAL